VGARKGELCKITQQTGCVRVRNVQKTPRGSERLGSATAWRVTEIRFVVWYEEAPKEK
jgi:hypothetical protein